MERFLSNGSINDDVVLLDSSPLLWDINTEVPEIRQIFGHFLPVEHRKLIRDMIAKDFNFPPAYHDDSNTTDTIENNDILPEIDPETIVEINHKEKIREDGDGAVLYTSYFNGFYMNKSAYQVLKCCTDIVKVKDIVSSTGIGLDIVLKFLRKAQTLGILNVNLA